jgi:hypothetical protein
MYPQMYPQCGGARLCFSALEAGPAGNSPAQWKPLGVVRGRGVRKGSDAFLAVGLSLDSQTRRRPTAPEKVSAKGVGSV